MKRTLIPVALIAGGLLLTGCVSKKQFEGLQADYNKLQAENSELTKSNQQAQVKLAAGAATRKSLEEQLDEARKNNADLKAQYASLQSSLDKSLAAGSQSSVNISKLVDEINASNKFIKQLVEAKDKSDSLNMALTNKLTRSLTPK